MTFHTNDFVYVQQTDHVHVTSLSLSLCVCILAWLLGCLVSHYFFAIDFKRCDLQRVSLDKRAHPIHFNCRDVEIYHLQKGKNVEGGVIQVKHTTIDIKLSASSDTWFTSLICLTHVSDPRRGSTGCIDCSKQADLVTELDPTGGLPLCIQPTYWVWYWSRVAREPSVPCEWEGRARQGLEAKTITHNY